MLVDSNVLLDLLTEDETWLDWSSEALADAAEAGPLFINPIVYAEVSVRFSRIEELDDALRRRTIGGWVCPGRRRSWRPRHSSPIVAMEVLGPRPRRTSSSEPTLRSKG